MMIDHKKNNLQKYQNTKSKAGFLIDVRSDGYFNEISLCSFLHLFQNDSNG